MNCGALSFFSVAGVVLISGLLSVYLCNLLAFSFVTHPINYCFLLLFGALSVSFCSYLVLGFSWYLVLFCLVYVGGVYVLFVFVSLHNPNPSPYFGGGVSFIILSFFLFWMLLMFSSFKFGGVFMEESHFLCSFFEGFSYCLLCLILMIGFIVVSVVSGDKDSFCR